ncbi:MULTISPECIES: cytochrome P450 [unclassified Streptomyces]|uniref:cytochrome P450 n=1 Tax=unclassified Streptomyces TaxID=2593676 RepID=UPI00224F3624|nr:MULTISPECIES: cytochrome P450 [unclassified Streptomyces]MCX4524145.1 cytochrome P450 [Streptomyces sp. NBC_01551]MCX4545336.1 cytochrome P450 [Streptomyces sp. NBC_01565]
MRSVPRAPGAVPLLGHALHLWRDPFGFLTGLREHGDLVRVDLGTMPMYVATSAFLVREVTVTQARDFEKGRFFDRLRPLAGNGLANSDGEVHRKHRRLIQPMFSKERIAGYSDTMSRNALALADSWTPGLEVDLEQAMADYAIETLASTLFSADIGLPAVAAVRENLPVLLKNLLVRAASPKFLDRLPIRANRDFDAASASLRRVIDEVILTARRSGDTERDDLLSLLLRAQDSEGGEPLTDAEVRDELSTILFAGAETTAATLAWTFHELAAHPEVEAQVVAEIRDVVGDGPVSISDVPRLVCLRRVIDEVIRLHGVTLLMRRNTVPVELGGFTLPVGTEVAFSLYAVHRDPDLYANPDSFDPDRWLPHRQAEAGLGREAYVPFGAGNRKCIGDTFVWAEVTIAIATLLSRWRLTPVPGHTPREVASAVARADRILMTVEPRRS